MHIIDDYVFDSDRLLVYKLDIDKEIIDAIKKTFPGDLDYKTVMSELSDLNSNEMCMDKIAINDIGICLTYNCNLRCTYCGYSSTDRDNNKLQFKDIEAFIKDIIEKRTIKKLITKKNEPLMINITGGGEPTYEWDLLKNTIVYIKHECDKNKIPLYVKMTTNGMLAQEQIEFISEHFNELMISYDGLTEIQNSNRICPNLKNTSNIVEHTIREFSKKGMPLVIRSTIWQKDYSKIKEMYHHVFSIISSDSNVIWSLYPTLFEGRAVDHMKRQNDIKYKDFLFYYLDLIEYIISNEGEDQLKKIDVPLLNNDLSGVFCGAYKLNSPWLLPDCSIVTCIESKDDRVCIGNVSDGKVEYFKKYKDIFLNVMKKKYSECRSCIAYRFCRGGCPVWHLRGDNQEYKPLECFLQQEYWNYILHAVLSGKYSFGWGLEKVSLPNVCESNIFMLTKNNN